MHSVNAIVECCSRALVDDGRVDVVDILAEAIHCSLVLTIMIKDFNVCCLSDIENQYIRNATFQQTAI